MRATTKIRIELVFFSLFRLTDKYQNKIEKGIKIKVEVPCICVDKKVESCETIVKHNEPHQCKRKLPAANSFVEVLSIRKGR